MKLELKEGYKVERHSTHGRWEIYSALGRDRGPHAFVYPNGDVSLYDGRRNVRRYYGECSSESFDSEYLHDRFTELGWESPWIDLDELTAAAEGEGPVDATPRLCAVDRLEAAGYKLQAHTGTPAFVKPDARINVVVGRVGDAYRCSTAGDISKPGDPCPGLNAALESLLSKPVGAVTVAQILGVA